MEANTGAPPPELVEACKDYGSYLDFPALCDDSAKSVAHSVEKILTRGDEVIAVSHTIENDISRFQEETLPVLAERALNLKKAFLFVDRLQALADQALRTLKIMEIQIEAEEEALKSISFLKIDKEELETIYDKARAKEAPIINHKEFFENLKQEMAQITSILTKTEEPEKPATPQ